MSDLKGWDCEAAKVYGIRGIPIHDGVWVGVRLLSLVAVASSASVDVIVIVDVIVPVEVKEVKGVIGLAA